MAVGIFFTAFLQSEVLGRAGTVHINDVGVRAGVCHGRRLEAIILRQVCTHRVYDRMGAPTSTVIKHRVNEMRKTSAVLFAEQQKSNIPAQCR